MICSDQRVERSDRHSPVAGASSIAAPRTAATSTRSSSTDHGFSVLPITSLGLDHRGGDERVSTGMPRLDAMLGGEAATTGAAACSSRAPPAAGKTSLAAQFVDAACQRGERALYFAYEESPEQIVRNMRSIGLDLGQWIDERVAVVAGRASDQLRPRDAPGADALARRAGFAEGRRRRPDSARFTDPRMRSRRCSRGLWTSSRPGGSRRF